METRRIDDLARRLAVGTDRRGVLRGLAGAALGGLLGAAAPHPAGAAAILYPNLRALPPHDLSFDTVSTADGATRHVLRFSSTVWNAGQGPLELRGNPDSGELVQRLYDDAGGFSDRLLPDAAFVFHPAHDHTHFVGFAGYELWDLAPRNDRLRRALRRSAKITFCIMDTERVQDLAGSPGAAAYVECGTAVQGLSVGWGDTYPWTLPDQLLDLGQRRLRDGRYALRAVADPKNLLREGGGGRESERNNRATACFTVRNGLLQVTSC